MFYIWNNGEFIINLRLIEYIEVIEDQKTEDDYARMHLTSGNIISVSRELYIKISSQIIAYNDVI